MTLINIPAFSGLNILAAPQRIREDEATVAIGCDFRSLDLRPFKGDADTGMGTTSTAGIINNGASIFQWDATHWVGTLGDKNFARSPTFYADGSTGQRIFVCDNAAPVGNAWDWVQDVVQGDLEDAGMRPVTPEGVGSFFLDTSPDGIRRLGVPKPGDITAPTHIPRNGTVEQLVRSTKVDTTMTVDAASSEGLKKYDSINLSAPGIGDGPFTVGDKSADATPVFTLRNCRLTYVTAKVSAEADLLAKFNKTGHGLNTGDQVVFNKLASTSSGFLAKVPSGYNTTLWRVNVESADVFYLTNAATDANFSLTATATGDNLRYAVVASTGDEIDDVANVTVALQPDYPLHQKVTYNPADDTNSTWEIALDTLVERSYVVTWVNTYGDESEPSNPTKTFPVAQGDPVTFKGLPLTAATYPEGFGDVTVDKYRTPNEIRLYRTDALGTYRLVTTGVTNADGDVNGDFRKIDWTNGANDFVDTYPDTELGEPLATAGWQVPPKDLNGILITPGGSLVGYRDRSVFGSVPYAPYAVPIGNRVAFDYPVKGLVATSAGLVVVTEGHPALIVGDDPATWSIQKLEYPYGCVSRRSIVDMGEMAIYASADGLVGIAGAAVEILTKDTIKRENWQAYLGSDKNGKPTIRAAHAEGRYYAISHIEDANGGHVSTRAFMFDPRTRSFIHLTVDPGVYPIALYSRLTDDTLLILKSDGKVYGWNRGNDREAYTWRSKYFQMTRPELFGCGQILSPELLANHEITMRLLAWDGLNVYTVALWSNREDYDSLPNAAGTVWEAERRYPFSANINPFRLPVLNNRYTVYQVELQGTLAVGQVSIASTMDEIRSV